MGKMYYTFLLMLLCFGCNKLTYVGGDSGLQIYLKDTEGNSIKGAKVYLQGDGSEELQANYDSKRRFYFFNQIPNNYHTVLAEHNDYNPKGYQNKKGLPREVHLELYNPYRVRLPGDTLNYYMEDPYKIVVMLNPMKLLSEEFSGKSTKEIMAIMTTSLDELAIQLGLEKLTTYLDVCEPPYPLPGAFPLIYIKKNQSKFKRFNSVTIENIRLHPYVFQVGQLYYMTKKGEGNIEYLDTGGNLIHATPRYKIVNYQYVNKQATYEVVKLSSKEQKQHVTVLSEGYKRYQQDPAHNILHFATNVPDTLPYSFTSGITMQEYIPKTQELKIVFTTNWLDALIDKKANSLYDFAFDNPIPRSFTQAIYQDLLFDNQFEEQVYNYNRRDVYSCFQSTDRSIGLGINDILHHQLNHNKFTSGEYAILHYPTFCR